MILLVFFLIACGKKTSLDTYPNSDYPKEYPSQNE